MYKITPTALCVVGGIASSFTKILMTMYQMLIACKATWKKQKKLRGFKGRCKLTENGIQSCRWDAELKLGHLELLTIPWLFFQE